MSSRCCMKPRHRPATSACFGIAPRAVPQPMDSQRLISRFAAGVMLLNPADVFATIRDRATSGGNRTVWVMRDLPVWLRDLSGAVTLRGLRSLTRFLPSVPRGAGQCVVVLAPTADIPPELATTAAAVNWPLPDRAEIGAVLDACIARLPEDMQAAAAPNGTRDAATDAAIGLSGDEAAACFSKSLVSTRKIDPATVAGEKKRIVAASGGLQWFDPLPGGLDSVGGLELLKDWLVKRKAAFGPKARAFELPAPKGIVLAGIQGAANHSPRRRLLPRGIARCSGRTCQDSSQSMWDQARRTCAPCCKRSTPLAAACWSSTKSRKA